MILRQSDYSKTSTGTPARTTAPDELNPATGTSGRLGTHSNENTIVVGTWMMLPGEAEIVGRRLHEVLSHQSN